MKIKYSYIDKSMSRFIFASYVDDNNDKYTRIYVTNDKTLTYYLSDKCKQIGIVLYHLSKREKETIIEIYCAGYEQGIPAGRAQIKNELKKILT